MSQFTRRILLDECVDWRLAKHLKPHLVSTVAKAGWSGIKNGQLLRRASEGFDVFITVDRNLSFQQHLKEYDVAVIVLHAHTNRLQDLVLLAPKLLKAIAIASPGRAVTVS